MRQGICAYLGTIVLAGVFGCNTITGLESLQFVPCAASFTEITATATQGSDGGSEYDDVCPDGQILMGLRGGVNGPVISGISAICGELEFSKTYPYTIAITPGEVMPNVHGIMSEDVEPESRMCPLNTVVVGFGGSTFLYDNQGMTQPIMFRITLHCAPIFIDGPADAPSFSVGPSTTNTDSLGGAEDQGDAFSPTFCPGNQLVRGIHGRSGLLLDAFGLGCAKTSLVCPGTGDSEER